ncbi:MAG: radical SAM family heme chaperone HemW [Chloroflexi bacterium]|nr:radical SAM family heme chaperone HemW [Chloroflexota bacterium]
MSTSVHAVHQGYLSLYLHIPFCRTKCNYCDFNTYAGIESLIPAYVDALVRGMEMWGRAVGPKSRVDTVFLGGGTPSLLPVEDTDRILQTCATAFELSPGAEVTLESNPGDLTHRLLEGLLAVGVNRLSIGVQSFNNAHLVALTRRHSAAEAAQAFRMARDAGFDSINLDLMYGLPRQSLSDWVETLDEALGLSPRHLSLYALTLEEGTPLWKDVDTGAVPESDSDLAADMYLHAEEALGRAGFVHYEISNWAKPGYECRHNLTYWRNGSYLGLGAGAHSYYGGYRFSDERNPRRYIERVTGLYEGRNNGQRGPADGRMVVTAEMLRRTAPIDHLEAIDEGLEMAETMMMGLRLMEGVSYEGFDGRFGRSLDSMYGAEVEELVGLGLLERCPSTGSGRAGLIRLTPRGRLLGNEVFGRFLSDEV